MCTAVAELNFGVPRLAREFPKALRKAQIQEFFLCELRGAVGIFR